MIPAGFLTIPASSCSHDQTSEGKSTFRLLQFQGHYVLLSLVSRYRFLPHTVPSPGCLFITPLATPRIFQILRATSTLFRLYVLHVSDLHLPFRLITRSEMSLPTASAAAPPIHNECHAISSGLRRGFGTTSLTVRRARPYLKTFTGLPNRPCPTTITLLPNRYEARGE